MDINYTNSTWLTLTNPFTSGSEFRKLRKGMCDSSHFEHELLLFTTAAQNCSGHRKSGTCQSRLPCRRTLCHILEYLLSKPFPQIWSPFRCCLLLQSSHLLLAEPLDMQGVKELLLISLNSHPNPLPKVLCILSPAFEVTGSSCKQNIVGVPI